MQEKFLTDAIIKKRQDFLTFIPSNFIDTKGKFRDCSYVLIIRLFTRIFAKLTIYPLYRDKIVKIVFIGFDIQDKFIKESIKELKKFKIIHTSGLTSLGDNSYYECYLDLSINDKDYNDLNSVLDNFKNIFEDIKIVEIFIK